MFMHCTYTVPHGPLLGQRETTSARFIGFMKCVSGTIVREMLHNNSVAFLKPCFQCLSTFNLLSFIKSIVMHSLQTPHRHQTASTSYLETLKCISWGSTLGRSMLKCSTNSTGGGGGREGLQPFKRSLY